MQVSILIATFHTLHNPIVLPMPSLHVCSVCNHLYGAMGKALGYRSGC